MKVHLRSRLEQDAVPVDKVYLTDGIDLSEYPARVLVEDTVQAHPARTLLAEIHLGFGADIELLPINNRLGAFCVTTIVLMPFLTTGGPILEMPPTMLGPCGSSESETEGNEDAVRT
jgi:hypothetical protein